MEIMRCGDIAPTGLNHMCRRNFSVNGMIIPANTMIQPLLTEILKGNHWEEGSKFIPDRFLNNDGNVKMDDHLIPFSIGKRQCLVETLAKAELFLFFTSLIHQFRFLPEEDDILPRESYTDGITIAPAPFKARLVSRM